MGGTSSIDDMVYIRGNRHVYDEWAKKGAEGWSFRDVEPYFIKAENYTGRNPSGEVGFNSDKCMQVLYIKCVTTRSVGSKNTIQLCTVISFPEQNILI